jgi:hypothetical protein
MSCDLWLVIPIGPRIRYIDAVISNSLLDPSKIVIVKDKQTRIIDKAVNIERPNILNIQVWWQIGIEFVEKKGGRYVAILSDDIELLPGQLQTMHQELINNKVAMISSKISGKYGWGHAFIIDLASGIRPDSRFTWYFGDYDLKYQAKRHGGFMFGSQEIVHLEAGNLTQESPDLREVIIHDRKLFGRKYPFKWTMVRAYSRSRVALTWMVDMLKERIRK